jgi:GNAT superfamily N-acetyltransferase
MGLTINGRKARRPRRGDAAESRTLGEMGTATSLTELTSRQFLGEIETSLAIYGDAMAADPVLLPGRRDLMRRHASYPSFRALQARTGPASPAGLASPAGPAGPVVGFAYGFHGCRGQWWYDAVWNAMVRSIGAAATADWLSNCLEVAELHVLSSHQRGGLGTALLTTLTSGRSERTAVLSTPDRDTTARRLYRRMGFVELVTGYSFPGGSPPYLVMGADLPLRDSAADRPADNAVGKPFSASPSIS